MFTQNDVAEYYNTTQNHYESWWDLNKGLSLHYGIWTEGITNFSDSLANTNRILMELAEIKDSEKILDAGCGVGGSAVFLTRKKNVLVTGISLSEKQVSFAKRRVREMMLDKKIAFHVMDYGKTPFIPGSFDVVWACESLSSAPDKTLPIKEFYRLLKDGGRLILSDFFLAPGNPDDKKGLIGKWERTWSIPGFVTSQSFMNTITEAGFKVTQESDYTAEIYKSSRRMYLAALLGAIPSEIYNLFHPKVSRFARKHYMCGYYQFRALQAGLWRYNVILAVK
jgi:tocopherol O-methyltransferase